MSYPVEKYALGGQACNSASLSHLTLRENLVQQRESALANVQRLDELLALLDAHPETNRILELLGRGY